MGIINLYWVNKHEKIILIISESNRNILSSIESWNYLVFPFIHEYDQIKCQ